MRAVVTDRYGSGPVLTDIARPTPGTGEIRVKIRSASLNGFDVAMASGYLKGLMEHSFPVVIGKDFAGTVDEVGEGVTRFAPGDDVFGVVMTQPLSAGSFGEFVVVAEAPTVARMPAGVDHVTAGVLGLAGCAAIASLDAVSPGAGETVLVSGATGGVGAFVVQMAAARGATVIATAAGGAETRHIRDLGAAHVVDHTQDLAEQVRAIAGKGVDVVLHFAGDPFVLADLVADGGRFGSLLMMTPDQFSDRIPNARPVYASPQRELLEAIASDVAVGRLRIPIQRSYTLEEVPTAFADFAAGTLGKLAVTIG